MDSWFNYPPYIPTYKASQDTSLLSYNTPWTRLTHCICEYVCMHSVKLLFLQAAESPTCYSASWLVCWPAVNIYKNVIMIERPTDMTRTLKKEVCLDHSQKPVAKKCLFNFEKSLTGTYEGSQLNVVFWSISGYIHILIWAVLASRSLGTWLNLWTITLADSLNFLKFSLKNLWINPTHFVSVFLSFRQSLLEREDVVTCIILCVL